MTIFELVKIALDRLYAEGKTQYGNTLDTVIDQRISALAQAYQRLNTSHHSPIHYKDPATRFAYVYKYVTAHADYLVQILQQLYYRYDAPVFQTDKVRLTCIGGGPGSDIIGVLKYLELNGATEPVRKIFCSLLDREYAWADTWTEVKDSLNLSINVDSNYQPFDVTDAESWKSQQTFLKADIFTLSYFVSEVKQLDTNGQVSKFWTTLFQNAKAGALFIYVDNAHSGFTDYFDAHWQDQGVECLLSANSIRLTPRSSEQASELAEYRAKFSQSPKLQGTLTYKVLRKTI